VKILLDECVPVPLARLLPTHSCSTVESCGWKGIKNGKLAKLAEEQFDLLITADQSLQYQQNLTGYRIGIVVLSSNNYRRLVRFAEALLAAIEGVTPGEVRFLIIQD
jgi:predicted nuclease of predicted toxin-antitoxin system